METLRSDDVSVDGARFSMSYISLTLPGAFRDAHQWHLHKVQTDRFVVLLGEMMLALFDQRPDSPTNGTLEVIRMVGASPVPDASATARKEAEVIHLVPIPPGVLHCIGNLSPEPFLLQNYPTELYNSADEGRVPFTSVTAKRLGGPFDWARVKRPPGKP
jgi:dTDP-4-dehydrorhamnose 3,5-epimerase